MVFRSSIAEVRFVLLLAAGGVVGAVGVLPEPHVLGPSGADPERIHGAEMEYTTASGNLRAPPISLDDLCF